jgi:osmoprotectant transport system permease protein
LIVLYAGITMTFAWSALGGRERPVVIGAKTFTEQYVLSEILAEWVGRETGRPTALVQSLGSTVAFDALDAGDIDLYVEYSGTLWTNAMGRRDTPASRGQALEAVERFLRVEHEIPLVARLGFENAYALAVRRRDAERLRLSRISDLTPHSSRLVMGGDYEFFARPEWQAIRAAYDLQFTALRTMDPTLLYQAAAQEDVDVISAFSSDGRVSAYDLMVLEDDRASIPPYDAIVLASRRLARQDPDVVTAVSRLTGAIPVDVMRAMNLAVDERGEAPSVVARRFVDTLAP